MINKIQSILSRKPKRMATEDFSSPTFINAKLLEAHAVNCGCGYIAIPTGEKGDTYKCVKCAEPANGPRYNFGQRDTNKQSSFNPAPKSSNELLNIEFYNDAVELLKHKRRQ